MFGLSSHTLRTFFARRDRAVLSVGSYSHPYSTTTRTRPRSAQHGAALLELGIVLPFVLLLMLGITELGRMFSYVTWFSGVSYEAALTASESSAGSGAALAMGRFQSLFNIHLFNNNIRMISADLPSSSFNTDALVRTVRLQSNARPVALFDYLGLDFAVGYVSGLLLSNPNATVGALDQFQRDVIFYGCDGEPSVQSDVPC